MKHRFYAGENNFQNETINIKDKEEIHHIRDVLRLKKNDKVSVFNEKGEEAFAEIEEITMDFIRVKILSQEKKQENINQPSLVLACAIPKKAKFEFILEKTSELGVDEIIPLLTKRTEVVLDPTRAQKKLQRYQTVLINACKQSQRKTIPILHPLKKFNETIKEINSNDLAFIPCLVGKRQKLNAFFPVPKNWRKIFFFIGPEGDFTSEEIATAVKAGCIPITLGENVLKVDTAAISVIAFAKLYL